MSSIDTIDGASALLAMPGFRVLGQAELGGELCIEVETTSEFVGCRGCGTRAVGHGRSRVAVRDLPIAGRAVVIAWLKRRWRCPDADCEVRTFTESAEAIQPRAVLTERARRFICEAVGRLRRPVSSLAEDFGIGWHTAWAAVRDYGTELVDSRDIEMGPRALGLDDHNFARGRHDAAARWSTVFIDAADGTVIDVTEGRDKAQVRAWLAARGPAWCSEVRLLCTDAHEGYRAVARLGVDRVPPALANATVVADPFHVVGLFNDHLRRCRLRVQHATLGRRGRRGDPLYGIRRSLLVGFERLSPAAVARIEASLEIGDPTGAVRAAWIAKERMRAVYALEPRIAGRAFDELLKTCKQSKVPELRSAARWLRSWRSEILAFHRHRVTTARNEAVNLQIELIIRTAHGFRNYANYRLRVLLRLGVDWKTVPTARIRGRQPRLAA